MNNLLFGFWILCGLVFADFWKTGQTGLTNPYLIPAFEANGGVTQYLVFHGSLAANFTSARSRCLALGGDLADVESVEVLEYLAARLHQPAFVASWLGSHMGFACMAVFPGGAIAVPEQGCIGKISSICEVPMFGTASIHIGVNVAGKNEEQLREDYPDTKVGLVRPARPVDNPENVVIMRNGKRASSTIAARTATMTLYGSIATNPALPCCKCC